jgi:uncharacterized protein (DUF1330 family)
LPIKKESNGGLCNCPYDSSFGGYNTNVHRNKRHCITRFAVFGRLKGIKIMPAYVVSMMSIHDPETYRQYTDRTPPIVKKYGGRFLTRGEAFTCVEGNDYDGRLVILEFPTKADVEAWFNDPDYQEAMTFRHAASTMNYLLLQEGGANTEDPDPKL